MIVSLVGDRVHERDPDEIFPSRGAVVGGVRANGEFAVLVRDRLRDFLPLEFRFVDRTQHDRNPLGWFSVPADLSGHGIGPLLDAISASDEDKTEKKNPPAPSPNHTRPSRVTLSLEPDDESISRPDAQDEEFASF